LRNLLIFYGGADPQNQTMVALKGIEGLPYSADIVVGPSNSNFSEIEEYCKHLPGKTVHRNLAGMAQIMEKADLCLGAGGSTTWERCAMGLPSLVTVLASNQLEMTEEAQKAGLHIILGHAGKVKSADFHGAIEKMSPDLMAQLSTTGMAMVDALGATRVADQILN
jgi:spore coat polysaccharide biosynthesis predicted glycosyltransferase SpsG